MKVELSKSLENKYKKLREAIKSKEKLLIAFSGGVDSALLAKIAYDVLDKNAWAVMIASETVPKFELAEAAELAQRLGINFEVINVIQLSDGKFTRNDIKRCYHCRKKMAQQLKTFAAEKGIINIAAGAQASDLDDYRPGINAFHEEGIWHPFIDLKITKEELRKLARFLGLPVANKPSMACLSSRIPYGQKITPEALNMIAAAEDYLRELGFRQCRARIQDKLLRIEINQDEIEKIIRLRTQIIKRMKELGYTYVTLDLEGFRSGSMNEVLDEKNEY